MAEQKLTVREAAAAAEVGASTIVSWRGGALPEDYRAVKSLAKRLGVSFSYLLTGEDESRPDGALVSEVFDEDGAIFDGYAHIRVIKLVPKRKDKK